MTVHQPEAASLAADLLNGADAIAAYLGGGWNRRKVCDAGKAGSLPIRKKKCVGIYAFKSELVAALKAPDTLEKAP